MFNMIAVMSVHTSPGPGEASRPLDWTTAAAHRGGRGPRRGHHESLPVNKEKKKSASRVNFH